MINRSSVFQKAALNLIKLYQATPTHIHSACRYHPTCSQYTYEAIQKYGILKGSLIGVKRILRCHPRGGQGYDPLK